VAPSKTTADELGGLAGPGERGESWAESEMIRVLEFGRAPDGTIVFADSGAGANDVGLSGGVDEWLRGLARPSLILQRGADSGRVRIVSTLLHGNEPSGTRALHRWFGSGQPPATDVLFLITGIEAALLTPGFAHRILPGGVDLNRCWLPPFEGVEGEMAQQALRLMRESGAECLIDLHNNTGHNPPYGVGPDPGAAELKLVSLFGERFVHSPLRLGTLVEATRDDFPSVTIECGRSGDPAADATAYVGLERFLLRDDHELRKASEAALGRMQVLVDPVRVSVRAGVELAFGDGPAASADITVALDIDRHNFEELPAGTPIAWTGPRDVWPLEALGEGEGDQSHDFFEVRNGHIVTRRPLIPIMMTTNRANALADCLFYIVSRA